MNEWTSFISLTWQRINFAVLLRLVVIPFREDRGLVSRTVATSYQVCDGTQKVTFHDVLHEDHDRAETHFEFKKIQFNDNSSLTSHVFWCDYIRKFVQMKTKNELLKKNI